MIVGIDLGTTNSLIAYYTDQGPKVIPNRLGEKLTPSIVSIDEDGTVYVGRTAQERLRLYPESSLAVFKRDMGSAKKYQLGREGVHSRGTFFSCAEKSEGRCRSLSWPACNRGGDFCSCIFQRHASKGNQASRGTGGL